MIAAVMVVMRRMVVRLRRIRRIVTSRRRKKLGLFRKAGSSGPFFSSSGKAMSVSASDSWPVLYSWSLYSLCSGYGGGSIVNIRDLFRCFPCWCGLW